MHNAFLSTSPHLTTLPWQVKWYVLLMSSFPRQMGLPCLTWFLISWWVFSRSCDQPCSILKCLHLLMRSSAQSSTPSLCIRINWILILSAPQACLFIQSRTTKKITGDSKHPYLTLVLTKSNSVRDLSWIT